MKEGAKILMWVCPKSLEKELDRATWTETANELSGMEWRVILIAAEAPVKELDEQIRVICLPMPSIYILGYLIFHIFLMFRIACLYRQVDVILFSQTSELFIMPFAALRKLLKRPYPRIVMDSRTVPMQVHTKRALAHGMLIRFGNYLANQFADGQTAISMRLAEAVGIDKRGLLGVWPSGAKTERFLSALSVRQWPQKDEALHALYLGTLSEERNLLALCEAVRSLRKQMVNVTLTLVGTGPQKIALEEHVRALGDCSIRVRPAVPHEQVPMLMSQFSLGVLPFPDLMKFRVSSPIKLFEYMAAGMPIVATRIVCHTDVIGDGRYVFWAENASVSGLSQAIRSAWEQRDQLRRMGKEALHSAQEWTWKKSARKLRAALDKAVDQAACSCGARVEHEVHFEIHE